MILFGLHGSAVSTVPLQGLNETKFKMLSGAIEGSRQPWLSTQTNSQERKWC
jgi:hypothetical protein